MKLEYVKRNGVFDAFYTRTKLQEKLEEFANSNEELAKVAYLPHEYASLQSAYGSIRAAIKRFGYCFHVRMIDGAIYLDRGFKH